MFNLVLGIIIRIFSNSYINVFQKLLTNRGEVPSVINFYTYLGLIFVGYSISSQPIFSLEILNLVLIMGLLGALGNYFIIKALSNGELSTLAPINSYKPIIALLFGIFLLKEIPSLVELLGILLIILGTIFLGKQGNLINKAVLYRFFALIFSGTEAVFIKKVIIATNINSAFLYWAVAGFIFSAIFLFLSKNSIKIQNRNVKFQIYLIITVALMQYSTNYVFKIMNVAYALALFQLSTITSIFLGASVFKEKRIFQKIIASILMLLGAVMLIIKSTF